MNRWTILAGVLFFFGSLWLVTGIYALYKGTIQGGISNLFVFILMIGGAWYGGYICLRRSRAISAPIRRPGPAPPSPVLPPPPPPPPPTSPAAQEEVEPRMTGIAEAEAISEASMSEWQRRYRFLSSQKSGSGCRFKDSSDRCVSPSPDYPIVGCTWMNRDYQSCFVYPVLMQRLPLWNAEYRNRVRIEAEMAGPIGECGICGNTRKLNQDRMCSVCFLALNRGNEAFDQMGRQSGVCDWCMKEITRGEAFLPVTGGYLCCADCWKTTYAKY